MVTEANTQSNYRYPGSRPFYDNDIDRLLFFGRDKERETLLHKVLADNLVVLYARSGLGKTSLLNAGLNQALRDRGFISLTMRLNDPELDPVQWIYDRIREIVEQEHLAFEPGEEATLWQYFKTTYFWSGSNKMLKPVLILDQFEEFFTLYSPESRKRFIRQMADVVNNKIPASLLESLDPGEPFPYSDNPSNMKIIISIREDYVGQLDEMSREIPGILHHRFRLLPLSREQARQAIIKPSQVQDEAIRAVSFTFAPEAVDMMLNFLCRRRERGIITMTDEVESFQLQLLCRHIELKVGDRERKGGIDIIIDKEDLGGEPGMRRVLQQFYDDQVKELDTPWKRRKARMLCEKGLISSNDLRLSLEEGEIKHKFRVSENLLIELVNSRLLRAEPRVGSVYYELSHDTLVAPIRDSQKKRNTNRDNIVLVLSICAFLFAIGLFSWLSFNLIWIKRNYVDHLVYGLEYYNKGEFNKAIDEYKKAVALDPKYPTAYNNIGAALNKQKKYNEAIDVLKKAIELDPKYAFALSNIGNSYFGLKRYNEAIAAYKKAIEIDPGYIKAKTNLAFANLSGEHFNDAYALANDLLKDKDISTQFVLAMRFVSISSLVFQGKRAEAVDELKDFIKFYRSIHGEYERTWIYSATKEFITDNKKLTPEQRKLLLQLVDLLESPKKEGDKKLKELENAVKTALK